MFGAIAGGIASALAGGAMSKLFGGGQKAASGGIQGDVLATDNNTVGMGDAGIKSAIQGSNVPNPDEAVPSFVSGAMAKAGKGLLEGTLQAGTSAVSDKLLDLVGLGGKSAADKGKDTRDYLAAAFPELNASERAGADASSAGMVDAGFENQKELTKMQLDNQKEIAEMQNETQKDRKSGSAGMPRPISYAVFCLKKKKKTLKIGSQEKEKVPLPHTRTRTHLQLQDRLGSRNTGLCERENTSLSSRCIHITRTSTGK